jgi:hypothetical protein
MSKPTLPGPVWDWNGVIGTGQSLAVGAIPVVSIVSVSQPHANLKLALGEAVVPPWNPADPSLHMAPLVEPLRPLATEYPSPYPANIYGETLHSAMANQVSALAKRDGGDHVSVHSAVGECGQGIVALKKQSGDTNGIQGRAYAAALFEVTAIARLAREAGKSFGVRAIVMTHGETDWESLTYRAELIELLEDWNRDLTSITGQAQPIPLLLSQQFAFPVALGERPSGTHLQGQLGVERPGEFVCTGPKYQYPGEGDAIHLTLTGYHQLGEKTGQVYFERFVRGVDWQPLHPLRVERRDALVVVHFHVPVLPLVWDASLPDSPLWPNGRGFELYRGAHRIPIEAVTISGSSVAIRSAEKLPERGLCVAYAMSSNGIQMDTGSKGFRWGRLRDSDPLVGSTTGMSQPNFCVSFDLPVP